MKPEELLYAPSHEWVAVSEEQGGKIATVGISSFAVEALTDLVYLDLPEVGSRVKAGDSCGEIESVKAVSDLYAPVSGEVVARNEELPSALGRLSEDPYGAGWIVKIKISDDSALADLMDYEAYRRQCAEEG